ncbi:diguanylate cyclase [Tundrisphaera lichenicola]|uniref:GGDEF domain-containing protein n=1 Tax=Tundrisphaera lichenicola TaxID=2029860 RepID=UPI003EB8F4AB
MIETSSPLHFDRRSYPARLDPGSIPESFVAQLGRLRFTEPRVEAAFRSDYFAGSIAGVRINLIFGLVVFAVWALVDRVVLPDIADIAWSFRVGVACPVFLVASILSFSRRFDRLMVPTLLVVDLVSGLIMIAIIVVAGAEGHRYYYAALMLVTMGCSICPGLRFRASMAVTLVVLVAYELALWSDATPRVALNNSMFLWTAQLLAASVSYSLERQNRSDFLQRWVIRQQSQALQEALQEVDRASRTDSLTGLFNRRHFFNEAEVGSGRVSVIILDVDHFKLINDRFGHSAGDRVLRELGRRVREAVRPGDIACRYGGEEFAILLPGADLVTAATVGERVRKDVEAESFDAGPASLRVTISAGVASISDGEAAAIEALIDHADQALYQAKHAGRNRVRTWDRGLAHAEAN